MSIDLHTHSSCSDGTDSPSELVVKAAAAGLDVVALTDHDTTAGWAEASETAQRVGIALVRGIELSTDNNGQSQHLLAYEVDPSHVDLVRQLERGVRSRAERVPRTIELLRREGVTISEAAVQDAAGGGTSGRPHIADAMVEAKYVSSRAEAFDKYLAEGRSAYVGRDKLDIEAAIALVADAGGVSVVAHPRGRGSRFTRERFEELRSLGLAGIEVDHQEHAPEVRSELRTIAADLGLVATGASDYHGSGKKGHPLGCNTTSPVAYDALMDRMTHARVARSATRPSTS